MILIMLPKMHQTCWRSFGMTLGPLNSTISLQLFFFLLTVSLWKDFKWALREKWLNMEFFLVRIFMYSDWKRRFYSVNFHIQSEYRKTRTRKSSVFGHFSHSGGWTWSRIPIPWNNDIDPNIQTPLVVF